LAHHLLAASCLAALTLSTMTACGSGLSGSSTCQDFMNASGNDQTTIIDKLATQYGKADYTSPLGRPEVPYYCASHPHVTLDQFFSAAG